MNKLEFQELYVILATPLRTTLRRVRGMSVDALSPQIGQEKTHSSRLVVPCFKTILELTGAPGSEEVEVMYSRRIGKPKAEEEKIYQCLATSINMAATSVRLRATLEDLDSEKAIFLRGCSSSTQILESMGTFIETIHGFLHYYTMFQCLYK